MAAGAAVATLLLWLALEGPRPDPMPTVDDAVTQPAVESGLPPMPTPVPLHRGAPVAGADTPAPLPGPGAVPADTGPGAADGPALGVTGMPERPTGASGGPTAGPPDRFERMLQSRPTSAGPPAPPAHVAATPAASTGGVPVTPAALPPAPRRPAKTAPPPPRATSPAEVCAGRTGFALYQCMQLQCAGANGSSHAQCVQLRLGDRAR